MARIEDRIFELIAPAVEALDFELWGVEFIRAGKHSTLRVYIDSDEGVSVDDCADVSHQVSAVLDVEDPISTEYYLEVSSPGMERPFFKAEQYAQYTGEWIAVELASAKDGKRKFKGLLVAVEEQIIKFQLKPEAAADEATFDVNVTQIKKAHLVPQF